MFDRYESERFGNYISELRKKRNVSMEQLSDGLCSVSMLGRFEKGDRLPGKRLRDRLLSRLGETNTAYENFLDGDEYTLWKLRQQLLDSIVGWQREKADILLEKYAKQCDMGNPLEKQFILTMKAQLCRRDGADRETLGELFKEALKQSVPKIDDRSIVGMCLSIQEVDLVLEYTRYKVEDIVCRQERYEEILAYIVEVFEDKVSQAKTYPKAVCYLCGDLFERAKLSHEEIQYILQLCNQAIEILRDVSSTYYVWELLQIRKNVLQILLDESRVQSEQKGPESLSGLRQETEEWLYAIQALHKEFGIPIEMTENCYLYVEKEVYCIGDVIRTRRKMLGLTRAQMCEGICSEKTLGRIERNQFKTQRQIVRELFDRLSLSAEYQRTELVTDNPEAVKLFDQIRWSLNERENEQVRRLLNKLKELVEMDVPTNRQMLERIEVINDWESEILSKEEYVKRMKVVLQHTLSYDVAVFPREKYMTNVELNCLQSIVSVMEKDNPEQEKCIETILSFYQELGTEVCISAYINMFEVMMSSVIGLLREKGDCERSEKISATILRECCKWHRVNAVAMQIDNLAQNYRLKEKKHIPIVKERNVQEDLNLSIIFSCFCKSKFREKLYREKYDKLKK